MRYRGAAMAEFWRALKTLKALQAEQAAALDAAGRRPKSRWSYRSRSWPRRRRCARGRPDRQHAARDAHRRGPNEPERLPQSPT